MLTESARAFRQAIEPVVASAYFSPDVVESMGTLGLDPFQAYFTGRAAALGAVSVGTVVATFHNWAPSLVAHGTRFDLASPQDALAARSTGLLKTLERLLAEDDGSMPDVSPVADLLEEACTAVRPEGRPLAAAHLGLPRPDDQLLRLWHYANVLREYRGDGHIAVLLAHGIDAVESLVIYAPYRGLDVAKVLQFRGWDEKAGADATERLVARGMLTPDGGLTDAGWKMREMIELDTDRVSVAPFELLGEKRCAEGLAILEPWAARVVERKGVPRAVVATTPQP